MVHKGFVIDFDYIKRIAYHFTHSRKYKYTHLFADTELLQQKGHKIMVTYFDSVVEANTNEIMIEIMFKNYGIFT